MSTVYRPAAKWRRYYAISAAVWFAILTAGLAASNAPTALLGATGLIFSAHRWLLHSQKIVLTRTGIISRSRFTESRIPYRLVGRIRFSRLTGDLVLERPWVSVRIPRRFAGAAEIRRAVSLAVWAHRGGDVPPDLAEADSAFV